MQQYWSDSPMPGARDQPVTHMHVTILQPKKKRQMCTPILGIGPDALLCTQEGSALHRPD